MPDPGFVTDEDLQAQVKATLNVDTLDAGGGWQTICRAANRSAYGTILAKLGTRGYEIAQIDQWDQGEEYQTDIGLWFAVVRGGLARDFDPKFADRFDRRKELDTCAVTIGGILVNPINTKTGVGAMDTTNDLHTLADDDLQSWYDRQQGPVNPPYPRG